MRFALGPLEIADPTVCPKSRNPPSPRLDLEFQAGNRGRQNLDLQVPLRKTLEIDRGHANQLKLSPTPMLQHWASLSVCQPAMRQHCLLIAAACSVLVPNYLTVAAGWTRPKRDHQAALTSDVVNTVISPPHDDGVDTWLQSVSSPSYDCREDSWTTNCNRLSSSEDARARLALMLTLCDLEKLQMAQLPQECLEWIDSNGQTTHLNCIQYIRNPQPI